MVERSGSEQRSNINDLLQAAAAGLALGAAIAGGVDTDPEPKAKAKAKAKSKSVPLARAQAASGSDDVPSPPKAEAPPKRQVCKCCGAVGRTRQGCSCHGGKSHQCLKRASAASSSSEYVPAGEPLVFFADTAEAQEEDTMSDQSWGQVCEEPEADEPEAEEKKPVYLDGRNPIEKKPTKKNEQPKAEAKKMSKPAPTTQGKPCPACESAMVLRKAHRGGCFWGCSRYPDCRGTRRPFDTKDAVASESPCWKAQ